MRFSVGLILAVWLSAHAAMAAPVQTDQVCFSRAEIQHIRTKVAKLKKQLELAKLQLKTQKEKSQLACSARVRAVQIRWSACRLSLQRRPPPKCACTAPWITTGLVVGACAATIITREVTR